MLVCLKSFRPVRRPRFGPRARLWVLESLSLSLSLLGAFLGKKRTNGESSADCSSMGTTPAPPTPAPPPPPPRTKTDAALDQASALFSIPLSELESEIDAMHRELRMPQPPGSIAEARDWGRATAVHGLAYASAMAVSKTATAPFERIRLLLQTQPALSHIPRAHRLQGLYHATLRIPRVQGYASLWRGNLANILRVVPHTLLRFSANDSYKEMLCGPGMATSRASLQKRITPSRGNDWNL